MISALKRTGILRRVLVALLSVAVVLPLFHAHDAAAAASESDSAKAAIVLSGGVQDRTDTAPDMVPDRLKGDCAACLLLKNFAVSRIPERSENPRVTECIVYPAFDVNCQRCLIAEHFRPPCIARV